jgi:AraC-like DNA-binding protein
MQMNAFLETRKYGSDFPVNVFYAADNNFLAHWHIDVEMVLVCEGSIRIGVNRESRVLSQGEMAVFGSTDIHYYDSREMHSTIVVLIFRPELVNSHGGWPENLRFTPAFMNLDQLNGPARNAILEIFHDIADEMKKSQPFYQLYVSGRISELCAIMLRHFPTCNMNFDQKSGKLPDIQKIQDAIQYLENNYMYDISLTDISRKSNLSPYYFSRLFTKFTGITFKEYLSRTRIAEAEKLIKTNQKSIIDISYECGFNSVRTFNRTFKTVKGFPPSQTRGN